MNPRFRTPPGGRARLGPVGLPPDIDTVTYDTNSYPFSTGYAKLEDVEARISAGQWDPNDPTASPTAAQVTRWLMDATGQLDSALATRGYYVPLTPRGDWTPPPGMATWNGIGLGAWLMLRNVAAAYAAHYVEASRHGGIGENQDANATAWMDEFNTFISKLVGTDSTYGRGSGGKGASNRTIMTPPSDNLYIFGVAGPFAPEPDPTRALTSGALGAMLADSSRSDAPLFTKYQDLGSGWEYTDPSTGDWRDND